MANYLIWIFDERLPPQRILRGFSDQEIERRIFPSGDQVTGIDEAIQFLQSLKAQQNLSGPAVVRPAEFLPPTEDEQRRLAEALRETAKAINQSLNLREVLDCILNKVGLLVPNDAANIMLIEDGVASMAACRGYEKLGGEKRVMNQRRIIQEVPNMRRMVETGQPIVIPDTKKSSDWVDFETSHWIHSYASVPISHMGRVIGFLNLNSATPNSYTPNNAEHLLAFADQAAIALVNARLYEKAQQEITDRKRAETALQEALNGLEKRVALRTQQLSQINEKLEIELVRRREAEKALEEERTLLSTRIEQRTAELSATNAELAKAVRLKDTFLANMSHELRTPLNAILNISETLEEQVFGEMNEAQLRSVSTIAESGRHLLSLINDILDISKIGAGKFELNLDYVSVQAVCQASLQLVDAAAQKKQLQISTTYDPAVKEIWADQRRVKQILVNLLANAVKFTPAGGTIGIDVTGDRERKAVEITVWDTGIGIAEEGLSQLFKPFVQLDSSLARQYEGTGLGLALVYHIVELHGGGIRVESEVGRGSRFIVTLNWDEGADAYLSTANLYEAVDLPAQLNSLHDPVGEGLINRYLNELEIEVQTVWLDKEAGARLVKIRPDFLVMDAALAENATLLASIRREPSTMTVPLIIVGKADHPLRQHGLPENSVFLEIPFTRQGLRSVLKSLSPLGTASLIHKVVLLQEKCSDQISDRKTILIVDDNGTSVRVISDYLSKKGYRVIQAFKGVEAIERARDESPSLILMDIQMPGMDGLEAIRRIRLDPRMQQMPIIAFTALAMPSDRMRCLAAGANDYMSKPLSLKKLVETIETYTR